MKNQSLADRIWAKLAVHTGGPLRRKTHGHRAAGGTSEYAAWSQMKYRCNTPTCHAFPNYGGRGISVCQEWNASFEAFLAYIGPKPKAWLELDRIDNDGNYEPGNVRWATRAQNLKNRRPSKSKRGERGRFV